MSNSRTGQRHTQRTIKSPVVLEGIGLHSGMPARLTLRPARPNRGIVFIRTDLRNAPEIPAHYRHVVNTQLATTLGVGPVSVSTVEHLLAALAGMGVDNLICEVEGPELPLLDGSSIGFCEAIASVGLESQAQVRPLLALRRRVEVKVNEKWAIAEPSARLEIQGSIEYDHPSIGYQEFHYQEGKTEFLTEIARARTFCMLKDVETMHRMGLAKGGSLANAVVLSDALVVNPEGLRWADEFVRHKVLDALGDFKLAGIHFQAYFRLHRSGHDLNNKLLTEIFKDPDNFEIIDDASREDKHVRVAALLARAGFVASF